MDADGGEAGRMLSLLYTITSAGVDDVPAHVRPGSAPGAPGPVMSLLFVAPPSPVAKQVLLRARGLVWTYPHCHWSSMRWQSDFHQAYWEALATRQPQWCVGGQCRRLCWAQFCWGASWWQPGRLFDTGQHFS